MRATRVALLSAIVFCSLCFTGAAQVTGSQTAVMTLQPSSATLGTGETQLVTVKVAAQSGSTVPSGNVNLVYNSKIQGTTMLNGNGEGAFVVKNFPVGVTNAAADYQGDSNFGPVLAPLTITTVAGTVETATNAAAVPASLTQGMVTELNAGVQSAQNSPVPTGTMVFSDGSTMLASVPLDGNGDASYFAEHLEQGTHAILASYSGDGNYWPSVSAPVTVTVGAPALPPPADFTVGINPTAMSARSRGTITTQIVHHAGEWVYRPDQLCVLWLTCVEQLFFLPFPTGSGATEPDRDHDGDDRRDADCAA
jgi:hypothetical protein